MSKIYVLDACALIAVLSNEPGASKVVDVYKEVLAGTAELVMNAVNLLEVYYDDRRAHGEVAANKMLSSVKALSIRIVSDIDEALFCEAGRLKASYKISLADAFALAQTKVVDGTLLTADHHEFDAVEASEPIRFLWIR